MLSFLNYIHYGFNSFFFLFQFTSLLFSFFFLPPSSFLLLLRSFPQSFLSPLPQSVPRPAKPLKLNPLRSSLLTSDLLLLGVKSYTPSLSLSISPSPLSLSLLAIPDPLQLRIQGVLVYDPCHSSSYVYLSLCMCVCMCWDISCVICGVPMSFECLYDV